MHRIIVMAGDSLGAQVLEDCWEWCTSLATGLGENVLLATINEQLLPVSEFVFMPGLVNHGEIVRPVADDPTAPMSSAPFVYRDDGMPDWASMWTGFCELALFGGPPHRGDESALRVSEDAATPEGAGFDPVAEIRRGIYETTGLSSEQATPGWLTITCDSEKMAAWMCAAIILENVEARMDGERLLVPASGDFALKDQVKSVITVVAKTHHYWLEHVASAAGSARLQTQSAACRPLGAAAMRTARLLHAH